MIVLGVMSGTSADGVDLALVEFDGRATELPEPGHLRAFHGEPYPPQLRHRVLAAANAVSLPEAQSRSRPLEGALDRFWADAALDFVNREKCVVDLVCSHGQTLYHAPAEGVSYQWDHPELWRHDLSCPVVTDLRMADVRSGGQGAPLAPLLHAALYRSRSGTAAVANVGGMANVTLIPPTAPVHDWSSWSSGIRGWDTGPGNALIDACVQQRTQGSSLYDAGGQIAMRGRADGERVRRWMAQEPWFALPPPKSTGRDRFGTALFQRIEQDCIDLDLSDAVATVAELTVQSLAQGLRAAAGTGQLDALHVCGGGAHNLYLRTRWSQELGCPVLPVAHADAIEAWLMALIGYRTWHGLPSAITSVTGAGSAAVLGTITT